MELKSIEEEKADCIAAWKAKPRAKYGVHIHHEVGAELVWGPIRDRIQDIERNKPTFEQALRFRLMRPITYKQMQQYSNATYRAALQESDERYAGESIGIIDEHYYNNIKKAHDKICPTSDCPFDGVSIFP